jgi:hypothetical protein
MKTSEVIPKSPHSFGRTNTMGNQPGSQLVCIKFLIKFNLSDISIVDKSRFES